ncbi:MAG: PDGLE domain-containing protein [Phycisphaerae bacterium]
MTKANRKTLIVGLAAAVLVGGVVSYFASAWPDGLEKTQADLGADAPRHGGVEAPPVAFDEYSLKGLGDAFWANAAAGVAGSVLVFVILLGVGRLLRRRMS